MQHVLVCVLVASSPTSTSEGPKVLPANAEVRYNDGSLVKMTMLQENLEVMTKYGKLNIPFSDVRRITFGRHVSIDTQTKISEALEKLNDQVFKKREEAADQLIETGHAAWPVLKEAAKHANLEVKNRANQVLKKLADTYRPEELNRKKEDVIQTAEFLVVGRIENVSLKAHSVNFGEIELKLPLLRSLQLRVGGAATELLVDAAKHGSAPDQWLDTSLTVDSTTRPLIKSDGQVDLWPQGPGQYMTGPKGYTSVGKGGIFMAGTLVGRVGVTGKTFIVGELFDGVPTDEGQLFLHIVPSPWNNASIGNYKVRITTDFASTSSR